MIKITYTGDKKRMQEYTMIPQMTSQSKKVEKVAKFKYIGNVITENLDLD